MNALTMDMANVIAHIPEKLKTKAHKIYPLVENFVTTCQPTEGENLQLFADKCTAALFCECHIRASTLTTFGTVDAPLDPDEQADYRANRDLLEDHVAYERMKVDALNGRAFSNLVIEFTLSKTGDVRLLVIGGQHRFTAIQNAVNNKVDEFQGTKIYFGLETAQRLDVQLISNTNIAVSSDLLDRMYETVSGPELRTWCQEVGFLDHDQDFADKRQRGQPVTVRAMRTFIMNYITGRTIDPAKFEQTITTPVIADIGAVVFGSDQGLVGQFNDVVADYAIKTLSTLPGKSQVWAVGERVYARLTDAGLPLMGLFAVPNSVQAITPLIGQIQIESEAHRAKGDYACLYVFHNRPQTGPLYEPVSQRLLPLDAQWQQGLAKVNWPTKILPQVMCSGTTTLRALIREYLFISLFRACAESLASENASRLAAMERADKNIDELMEILRGSFHRLRQSGIDEELFDVVSGFEALNVTNT